MDRVEFAAIRPLDDFLLQSARFQLPNFKDPAKWANRVTSNLVYYQTNYFITALVMFLIVGSVSSSSYLDNFGCQLFVVFPAGVLCSVLQILQTDTSRAVVEYSNEGCCTQGRSCV